MSYTYHHLNVPKCRSLCGGLIQALELLCLFLAAPVILPAQACLPQLFQTGAFASLTPSGASHQVLLQQSDGSYTAFEIPNDAPYQVLSRTPNFGQQVKNCPNPEPSDISPPIPTGIYAATPSGGYMYAVSPPPAGNNAEVDVTFFDNNMNPVSSTAVTISTSEFENLNFQPLLIADLNHDGNPDLVLQQCSLMVPSEPSCALAVMLADGHGSFAQPVSYPLPGVNTIGAIVAADLTGDGNLDLVMSSTFISSTTATPLGIAVFLGKGDGTFQPMNIVVPGVSAFGLAVADVNHDGIPDLAFSVTSGLAFNNGLPGTNPMFSASVSVALGNGNGTFATLANYAVNPYSPFANIAIADVNGDGNEDIVIEGGSILFGDGKGGFPTRRDCMFSAEQAGPIIVTDIDGDGKLDIVIAGGGDSQVIYGDNVAVFFGQGGGEFAAPPFLNITNLNGTYPDILASGDFEGDGSLDLVVNQGSTFGILKANSDGSYTAGTQYSLPPNAPGVPDGFLFRGLTGDFNHDGKLDFAVVWSGPTNSVIEVFLGNGDGTFQPPVATSFGAEIDAIIAGDFNGDGIPDLAVGAGPEQAAGDTVQILLGNGDGTFRQGAQYPAGPGVTDIVAADFNGDGNLDLAFSTVGVAAAPMPSGGNVTILLGKGDGTFSAGAVLPVIANVPGTVTAADFNKDGKIDLAVACADYTAVVLGNGDGTFGTPMTYNAQDMVLAADVNGDGILDLVTGSGIMLGNGDGSFQTAIPVTVGGYPISPSFTIPGDFSQNGKLDFLFGDAIALNISTPPPPKLSVVSAATLQAGPLAPESLATAWGVNLAGSTEASQTLVPILGGASISVTDSSGTVRAAPLLYASPHQVNFLVPAGASIGPATLTLTNGSTTQTANVVIAQVAPGLFVLNENALAAAYAIIVSPTGQQTIENVFSVASNGSLVPSPISSGPPGSSLYLVLLGTGMGSATSAAVNGPDGFVGEISPVPRVDGLYQIKFPLGNPGRPFQFKVTVDGAVSNSVVVYFQ